MKSIKKFYSISGWKKNIHITKDAELFEDLRSSAKEYVSKCRLRILRYIPSKGGKNILDFASGPIQYKEYLKYSKNFNKRHCVDFSKTAIKQAKLKLGNKGKYYLEDFAKIKFKENYFDCIISMHTIYHINKKKQRSIVLKMLKIAKKKAPIIIVYSNPKTLISFFKKIFFLKKKKKNLYFYCHPNNWWFQFENIAHVKIFPWRSFSSQHQKILFPNNYLGKILFKFFFKLEDLFPKFFSNHFQYQIIILKKR